MSLLPQRFSIKYHIIGHFSVAVAVILMVSGVVIFSFVYENVRQNMMEKLAIATTSVKDVVENAAHLAIRNHLQAIAQMNIALLVGLEQQVRTGRISKLEAMKRGEEILLQQPIGDHGYIYVLSSQGVVQVHPHAEIKHADLSEQWFVRQQMFYKNGFLEYDWQGPGEEHARAKVLYMLCFEPWDWIVSVSSYRQDFNFLANDLRWA